MCSGANLDLVRSLGAADVVDYTTTDPTATGRRYDVIVDAVGKLPRSRAKGALARGGRYLSVLSDTPVSPRLDPADLMFLKEQIEAGRLKAVIDRAFPLEQIVEAHRYVDLGHKKGNVVVTVA